APVAGGKAARRTGTDEAVAIKNDLVAARREIGDAAHALLDELEHIGAAATREGGAVVHDEKIVTAGAVHGFAARAVQRVVTGAVARRACAVVAGAAAYQRIVAVTAKEQVAALIAVECVVAVPTLDRVVTEAANNRIVARGTDDITRVEHAHGNVGRDKRGR